MTANINPETGVRYGIISADSLDPEIVDEIQQRGTDVHFLDAQADLVAGIAMACDNFLRSSQIEKLTDRAQDMLADVWQDDEPVREFDLQGVKGRTTWLGGALHVWVFESPVTGVYRLCSPCVPNCGDLNSPADVLRDKVGEICYDVPNDWRVKE